MFPACPVRNILARLCDKWALLVLYLLARSEQGKLRFTELKQAMRTLEEDGYISRRLHAEVPPRVEYALTERGQTLRPILEELLAWAVEQMDDIMKERKRAHNAANGSNQANEHKKGKE